MAAEAPAVHVRTVVLGLVLSGCALALAGRLFWLQVVHGGDYAAAADQSRVMTEIIQPRRGRILDRSGTAIADTRLVYDACVVMGDLEVSARRRRDFTVWRLDERRLGELLADLTGRVRLAPGTSLRELMLRELTDHPAVAVRTGAKRAAEPLGLLVVAKEALNPFRSDEQAGDTATLVEGDLLTEDPLAALEQEIRLRWHLDVRLVGEDAFRGIAATLDRDFRLPEPAADLLDPFLPGFAIRLPAPGAGSAPARAAESAPVRLRLLEADRQGQAESALARLAEVEPALLHERLVRALAAARAAHPPAPSPVFFAPAMSGDEIAPDLPPGVLVQQVTITGVPGAQEQVLLIQGDPPDGEGLYTRLTRRIAANLGLDALSLQSLIEAHAEAIGARRAEQDYRTHLLLLDAERVERLAEGLARELTRAGRPVGRLEVDRLLAGIRRTAEKDRAGRTRRDPIPLFADIPAAFAIRFAGRDAEPPRDLLKRYDDAGAELPGLMITTATGRAYPFGSTLCHTLGTVGAPVDGGGPPAGRWGLEDTYDSQLRGLPGSRTRIRTPDGVRIASEDPPLNGRDLTTEIDLEVQTIAEDSLEHWFDLAQALGSATERMEQAQAVNRGRAGFVLLDCQTGGILAMASNPRFTYGQYASDYARLKDDPAEPLFDHAARAEQPPGSSFKILTALACLEYGVINPGQELWCQGYMGIGPGGVKLLRDHAPPGNYDLSAAIQVSSNVYFATIGARLGPERLWDIADKIGLGRRNALDVAQQVAGLLPSPSTIARVQPTDPAWRKGDTWNMSIGQNATASPLQCAVIAAAVANGGHIVRPFLVRPAGQPEVVDLHIRKEWLDDIRTGMERVTDNLDHSTARLLVLQGSAAGIKVAAKTGTAEWGSAAQRKAGKRPDHAWMIGYAPADNPTVAFACFVHAGTFGGQACTPIAKRVLESYFAKYGRAGHAP